MQRSDANSEHWKAKFIDGLPPLFAERVRQKLRDNNDGQNIPYNSYTYGYIISVITQVGLSICNDMKLQYQLKKQNLTGKKEIGDFCYQFAYDMPLQYPKTKKSSKKVQKKYFPKRKYSSKPNNQPSFFV